MGSGPIDLNYEAPKKPQTAQEKKAYFPRSKSQNKTEVTSFVDIPDSAIGFESIKQMSNPLQLQPSM